MRLAVGAQTCEKLRAAGEAALDGRAATQAEVVAALCRTCWHQASCQAALPVPYLSKLIDVGGVGSRFR